MNKWNHVRVFLRHTSSVPEQPRVNQLGIQYLSHDLHSKIFPLNPSTNYLTPQHPQLLNLAKKHLKSNDLHNKQTNIQSPISIWGFPNLVGKNLDEHFYKLGTRTSEPFKSMSDEFLINSNIPKRPTVDQWRMNPGWTRYEFGTPPCPVSYPLEDQLVFDVEVLYKVSKYPVMAVCASSKAWYGWVSPTLNDINKDKQLHWNHLIPMNSMKKEKLIIGYNVSYDRARIQEEYSIKPTKSFFLDGMALHVATSGICSRQRNKWSKHNKFKTLSEDYQAGLDEKSIELDEHINMNDVNELINEEVSDDPWLLKGTPNSLRNVAKFHCGIDLPKETRNLFGSEDPGVLIENFNMLMDYCATDVEATYKVVKKIYPEFLRKIPHPVSFGALKDLGKLILPTTQKWKSYIKSSEDCYEKNRDQVFKVLKNRVDKLIKESNINHDPWWSQLDWTIKQFKYKKDGTLAKRQAYMSGYPEWYRELFKNNELKISIRSRITPLLLKLKWEGYPLFWTDSQGWCFKVPYNEVTNVQSKQYQQAKLTDEEMEKLTNHLRPIGEQSYLLFKIPHPDSSMRRTTIVLSKTYSRYIEDGTLSSEYPDASIILKLNNEASYWIGNRQRIMDQFVVYNEESKTGSGMIIPNLATMGTITRRATENTWLTASNAKENRIGSELKSLIEAPTNYCFVGADVDSEELWIASLVGDSMFQIHGGTALGWMTLEGTKQQGTDLHSKTASILNISRNNAKIFNYGRIYGAGVKFAISLLKQFNPKLSDDEATQIANKLYEQTKGSKHYSKSNMNVGNFYYGGSESIMFNALEQIANQKEPKTPVLGAKVTDALSVNNLKKNTYMPSRVNWTIQSSGVDYLHLLIVSMDYLIEKYQIEARLAITVHDELRYLVKEEDKYVCALLLQISNVWTRAMFSEQMGIQELPQSCAFFSEIDIDKILRKEVGMSCKTPSNPIEIAPGESLDITQLLNKLGDIHQQVKPLTLRNTKYVCRQRVIDELDNELDIEGKIAKIDLQISNKDEVKQKLRKVYKSKEEKKKPSRKIREFDLENESRGKVSESGKITTKSKTKSKTKSYGVNKTPSLKSITKTNLKATENDASLNNSLNTTKSIKDTGSKFNEKVKLTGEKKIMVEPDQTMLRRRRKERIEEEVYEMKDDYLYHEPFREKRLTK